MGIDWDTLLADCVDFTQRLIQTPSMPGEEAAIAALIADEMRGLGFDEVWLDGMGNVNGRLFGRDRSLGALVLNSHTDHVDPGDPDLWPAPPFAAEIADGRILGRGACDIKGPLAVQVYSMAALRRAGERPRRDVVFSGVVEEEVGGAGALHWVQNLDYEVALVVLGEPSDNNIALGHRGIIQMWVTFDGRSVHASVPDKGVNPNYLLAKFLRRLQTARHTFGKHPLLGTTTVAPTIIEVDTTSRNVTPAWARVLLDVRTATESTRSLLQFVAEVGRDLPYTVTNAWEEEPTPLQASNETIYGFYTPPQHEVVQRSLAAIGKGMGWEPKLVRYEFATDGRHFVPYNIPIIGYSPAEEELAHTVAESISIKKMGESLRGYVQLLRDF